MEIRLIEYGRYRGRIDVRASIDTLAVLETWRMTEQTFNLHTVRNVCSRATCTSAKVFAVSAPGLTESFIKIKRLR